MARAKHSAARKYHDRVAGLYDHSYDDAYWQWNDALTWGYVKTHMPSDQSSRVLDLGCGTGKWGLKLAKSGYAVTFLDLSPKMLDQARRKCRDMGEEDRHEFVQADIIDLAALEDESFALCVAFGDPIGCASAPLRAMKEIRRVLTPGGTLIASLDNKFAALDYYLEKGDIDAMAKFVKGGVTHWLTSRDEEQFDIHTFSPAGIRRLVEKSGLDLIDLCGRTVLQMRRYRELLESPQTRRTLSDIEKRLCHDEAAMGRASHFQFVCRKP